MNVDQLVLRLQRGELTEHIVYKNIAKRTKDAKNREVIESIAEQELTHHDLWKEISGQTVRPNYLRIFWYSCLSLTLGYTFVLKRMEQGELHATEYYSAIGERYPIAKQIEIEEEIHEQNLISMLDEERLNYIGSMVLGLNDALVELTGTIAGLTFALQNTKLIALSGIITGISATLSMMSSEYLSKKSSKTENNALKASIYTGLMYILAVILMVAPYIILPAHSYVLAFVLMLSIVILLILAFNYYISIAQGLNFKRRFFEMLTISMSVALIAFLIGILVKQVLHIDI